MQVNSSNHATAVAPRSAAPAAVAEGDFAAHLAASGSLATQAPAAPAAAPVVPLGLFAATANETVEAPEAVEIPSYLLSVAEYKSRQSAGTLAADRPNVREFMDATGVDVRTASRLVYGATGAAPDMRDWAAIMSAEDPLAAARQATGQTLESGEQRSFINDSLKGVGYKPLTSQSVLARVGNFAMVDYGTTTGGIPIRALNITDSEGQFGVAIPWNKQALTEAAQTYNLDLSPLEQLADALDKAEIGYKPYDLQPGTSMGLDLRSVATGR